MYRTEQHNTATWAPHDALGSARPAGNWHYNHPAVLQPDGTRPEVPEDPGPVISALSSEEIFTR